MDRPLFGRAAGGSTSADSGGTDDGSSGSADAEWIATIRLCLVPGIGPRTLDRLLSVFETPGEVLGASAERLGQVPGLGAHLCGAIRAAAESVPAEAILQWCRGVGASVLWQRGIGYPQRLLEIAAPPPLLFSLGEVRERDELAVAIVGTRHATAYGLRQAERFAFGLAKSGVTVVSGLARGIDRAAHEGALSAGGRTIAVLGGGLRQIYPEEHRSLSQAISASGAVVSEFAPDAVPRAGMFPQRNRVIAGLSLATLVIEAPDRSGALITARLAGEQGREVLALPGPVTSRASRGCNRLIRDGGTLVQTVEDVLESVGHLREPVDGADGVPIRSGAELNLNELERQVLAAIDATSTAVDQVIARSGLPAHRVMATISVLEMRHLIRRLSGQYVARV